MVAAAAIAPAVPAPANNVRRDNLRFGWLILVSLRSAPDMHRRAWVTIRLYPRARVVCKHANTRRGFLRCTRRSGEHVEALRLDTKECFREIREMRVEARARMGCD